MTIIQVNVISSSLAAGNSFITKLRNSCYH